MTDWKKAAESQGIPLTAAELRTVEERLTTIDKRIAALAAQLPPDAEPACVFVPGKTGPGNAGK